MSTRYTECFAVTPTADTSGDVLSQHTAVYIGTGGNLVYYDAVGTGPLTITGASAGSILPIECSYIINTSSTDNEVCLVGAGAGTTRIPYATVPSSGASWVDNALLWGIYTEDTTVDDGMNMSENSTPNEVMWYSNEDTTAQPDPPTTTDTSGGGWIEGNMSGPSPINQMYFKTELAASGAEVKLSTAFSNGEEYAAILDAWDNLDSANQVLILRKGTSGTVQEYDFSAAAVGESGSPRPRWTITNSSGPGATLSAYLTSNWTLGGGGVWHWQLGKNAV
jgi:hypothetical protein